MPKRNHSELASSEPTSVLEVEPLDGEESKKAKHALKMRDWRAKNKANKKMVDPNSGIECDPTVNLEAITLDAYRQRQARKRPKSDLLDQTNKAKTNAEKQLQQEQEESKKAKHALKMRNWRAKNKDNKKMVDPDTGVECDPTVNLRAITLDAHRQRQARKGLKRSSLAQTNKAETKAEKQLAESAAINEAEELNEEAHASSRGHSQPNALVMPTGPSQVPTPALVLESQVIPTPALVLKSQVIPTPALVLVSAGMTAEQSQQVHQLQLQQFQLMQLRNMLSTLSQQQPNVSSQTKAAVVQEPNSAAAIPSGIEKAAVVADSFNFEENLEDFIFSRDETMDETMKEKEDDEASFYLPSPLQRNSLFKQGDAFLPLSQADHDDHVAGICLNPVE